jgi:hypothetical protein
LLGGADASGSQSQPISKNYAKEGECLGRIRKGIHGFGPIPCKYELFGIIRISMSEVFVIAEPPTTNQMIVEFIRLSHGSSNANS